jgi:hypothetical protein
MLDNLITLVKQNASAVLNNPDIPAEKKEEAINLAGTSIVGGLQSALAKGGAKDVMGLFNSTPDTLGTNPIMQYISGSYGDALVGKLGLNTQQAGNLSSALMVPVMNQFISQTNDSSNKTFDMQQMFNELSDGKTSGFNVSSLFAKFKAGMDRDGDGDVDMDDFKSLFAGSGGLLDKIKGAFK